MDDEQKKQDDLDAEKKRIEEARLRDEKNKSQPGQPSPIQLRRPKLNGIVVDLNIPTERKLPGGIDLLAYTALFLLFLLASAISNDTSLPELSQILGSISFGTLIAAAAFSIIEKMMHDHEEKEEKKHPMKNGQIPDEVREAIQHFVQHHL